MISINRQSLLIVCTILLALFIFQNKTIEYSLAFAQSSKVAGFDEKSTPTTPEILIDDIPLVRLQADSDLRTQNNQGDLSELFYEPQSVKEDKALVADIPASSEDATQPAPVADYSQMLEQAIQIIGFMGDGVIINNTFYSVGAQLTITSAPQYGSDESVTVNAVIAGIKTGYVILAVDGKQYKVGMR
jgi:hypothetical protein